MTSRFVGIAVTAAICLPLGAVFHREAAAERRDGSLFDTIMIAEHPRLSRAQLALHQALEEMRASESASEQLWADTSGRATAMRAVLEQSVRVMDDTVAWLRNGMARQHGEDTLSLSAPFLWQPLRRLPATP